MLGALDHVGYLAADLDAAIAEVTGTLGMQLVRRFEREQYGLHGAYLGSG
jgi:catechol 2,3-dioxygenase-like lactoylglutathione lyase family enzyme